jgi:hypothetical protein
MASLIKVVDSAIGYVESSAQHDPDPSLVYRSLAASTPLDRPQDVQERYIDRPEAFAEWEREGWAREAELARRQRPPVPPVHGPEP